MKIVAIEPFDGMHPGSVIEVTDKRGEELIEKGLAKPAPETKMKTEPQNKMAQTANTKSPSSAVGEHVTSSSSRAAQASRKTTAAKSTTGNKRSRARGK